jgi:2-keto-4-pentenoate hydratase/2-oxohepta-3-ene-1,7-dioic acid hydratase in catechol pathway
MRWIRAEHGGRQFFAIAEGTSVVPVTGTPFGGHERTSDRLPLDAIKLLPPVIPPTFYAAGMNYRGHAAEMKGHLGAQQTKIPTRADIGYRANNALVGDGDAIVIPTGSSGAVQYEPELVVVIGRKARNIAEADALSIVFGYTIGNDVSERTWQASDRTLWRAKNSDTFKPMGPWIETDVSLERLVTRVRLNGATVSEFPTNDMVFGVARYISEITRFITLFPGDVIWMGAEAPTRDMVAGDLVEIDIDGIGTLRNPVVAEPTS